MEDKAKNRSCVWGGTSVALPATTLFMGLLFLREMGKGVGGDMAGGALLVYGGATFGVVSLFGLFAAILSFVKQEKRITLGIIGILLNLPGIVYGLVLLLWKLSK